MPPKKAATPESTAQLGSLTPQNIKVLCTVLRGVNTLDVDWKSVAAELGISRADNA
jgi:hypothetical protein